MRYAAALAMGFVLVAAATTGLAWAQTAQPSAPAQSGTTSTPSAPAQSSTPSGYPNVANLTAFSADADYMSLPGYLRYLTYQQTQQWLTLTEADRIVAQQHGM